MVDVTSLLRQDEGQYVERKSLWHGPPERRAPRPRREVRDQVARYVAAFANADGGTLVLGAENDGAPSGHRYPEEVVDRILQVPAERLRPPLPPGRRVRLGEHELLVFEVEPTAAAVMVTGDGFPRRVHDQVIDESEEAINTLKRRGLVESFEAAARPGLTLDALDPTLLARARTGAGLQHLDAAGYLLERRLADERGGELVLRQAALLLFARHARSIDHPKAGVRVFRVRGSVRRTGPDLNVDEIARLEGAVPRVIEDAYRTVGGLVRRSARLHDLFFREVPEYPTFAWQEAIVNAVAHRDYGNQRQDTTVWLYDDRMEVVSPGALVDEVDLARLRRREPVHAARNPRVTRVLTELALMREQGEGIPRMFDEMERSWLRLPELLAAAGTFTVVLHNEPILASPDPNWVAFVRGLPVHERQRRILVANQHRTFANLDYQNLNQVDRDTAYRELRELVGLGLLTAPERPGRGARYRVASSARHAARPADRTVAAPRAALAATMDAGGSVQNADVRAAWGVDRQRATALLAEWTRTGVLRREGERRGTRYRPGPGWEDWVNAARSEG